MKFTSEKSKRTGSFLYYYYVEFYFSGLPNSQGDSFDKYRPIIIIIIIRKARATSARYAEDEGLTDGLSRCTHCVCNGASPFKNTIRGRLHTQTSYLFRGDNTTHEQQSAVFLISFCDIRSSVVLVLLLRLPTQSRINISPVCNNRYEQIEELPRKKRNKTYPIHTLEVRSETVYQKQREIILNERSLSSFELDLSPGVRVV